MRNLSATMANSEEEALNLLFIGDTNRMIAETPMNLASSRSHCIFTVTIESRGGGSDVIRRSKFNLVDLAGSERVHKTQAAGNLLQEAKYINLSLHYLEQVIVSLSEKRTHIPYRNSMMTGVLLGCGRGGGSAKERRRAARDAHIARVFGTMTFEQFEGEGPAKAGSS